MGRIPNSHDALKVVKIVASPRRNGAITYRLIDHRLDHIIQINGRDVLIMDIF
jgi:hypothetical protein